MCDCIYIGKEKEIKKSEMEEPILSNMPNNKEK